MLALASARKVTVPAGAGGRTGRKFDMRNPVQVSLRALARLALAISGIGIAMAQTPDFGVIKSENASFRLELIAENLGIPWGLAFLGNGRALVSERAVGKINLLDLTTGEVTPLAGVPKMFLHEFVDRRFGHVQPGMMDVAVHPDFANNHWVYFAYSMGDENASTLAVDRAKLEGTVLVERENLFEALPHATAYNHYGCRLVFKDGYLFLTMGERFHMKHSAQDLSTHLGTVIRIHDDGRVPEDNPFAGVEGAKKEIWSYGHRNSQGMVLHPETGVLWENEHGPQGGDEINIIELGLNYGWPVITYGEEYGGGPIGDGITKGNYPVDTTNKLCIMVS